MEFECEQFIKSEALEKRIETICSFNNAKCVFNQGRILKVKTINICFIEPHRVDITIKNKKLLLIYFDRDNLFLYNRTMPIKLKQLDILLKYIRGKINI